MTDYTEWYDLEGNEVDPPPFMAGLYLAGVETLMARAYNRGMDRTLPQALYDRAHYLYARGLPNPLFWAVVSHLREWVKDGCPTPTVNGVMVVTQEFNQEDTS